MTSTAERFEDVSIALVGAALATMAIADILSIPTTPLHIEVWLFRRIGAFTVILAALLKCAVALLPLGMLGGWFVRKPVLPAATVATLVALVFLLPAHDRYWFVVVQHGALGVVAGLALVAGAHLRRRIATPRPALPADGAVRLSVVLLDVALVPLGIAAVVCGDDILFKGTGHGWMPGAAAGAATIVFLGARWWQARRGAAPVAPPRGPTPTETLSHE